MSVGSSVLSIGPTAMTCSVRFGASYSLQQNDLDYKNYSYVIIANVIKKSEQQGRKTILISWAANSWVLNLCRQVSEKIRLTENR